MPQFDLHRTRGDVARIAPLLLVLQSDLLQGMRSVIVAPVHPQAEAGPIVRTLHVVAPFKGQPHVLRPEEMVSLPANVLGEVAGHWRDHRSVILAALDLLFTGY